MVFLSNLWQGYTAKPYLADKIVVRELSPVTSISAGLSTIKILPSS